jgi:hypothetical protein
VRRLSLEPPADTARSLAAISLGHFPEYVELGARTGARTFSMPDEAWNAIPAEEQWIRIQHLLDQALENGSEIRLATPLHAIRPGSFLERELQYLFAKGFVPSPDGRRLVPRDRSPRRP